MGTKPKKAKAARPAKTKKIAKANEKEEELESEEEKKLTKIWEEANESQIDRVNQRDLVKHFVASMFSGDLDKFDKTTKRLQRRYKALSQNEQDADNEVMDDLPSMIAEDEYLEQEQA